MGKFSKRSDQEEIMDDLGCSGEVVDQTLREISIINKFLGGHQITLKGLDLLINQNETNKPLEIIDVGCGSGEMLKIISEWGNKSGLQIHIKGIDANPYIVNFAQENCEGYRNIDLEVMDIFDEEFKNKQFDILVGTLVMHHFTTDKLINLFKQFKQQARMGVVINDLQRGCVPYYSIKWITRILSRSSMVKYDAPLSVLRGFTRKELVEILKKAVIKDYYLRWMWAYRWLLVF